MSSQPVTRRRLPHIYPPNTPLFVTWHLHGSLPHARYPPTAELSSGQAFAWMDRYLDTTRGGPLYLRQPRIAQMVVDAIQRGGGPLGHYQLHAYVVMPNHVHVLLTPIVVPSRLMQSLKGFTAREANKMLGRSGNSFWQQESYDHYARNEMEFQRIKHYIEWNPVKAGLCKVPEEFPWSSAAPGSPCREASWPKPVEEIGPHGGASS